MTRTKSSLQNIKYSVILQVVYVVLSFVSRTIFIRTLGAEYLGINGLFSNIITILSLVELGVGPAMTFALYKPLADRDDKLLQQLMYLFKRVYIMVGVVILILGIAFTPYIFYFMKEVPNLSNLKLIYILFIIKTSSSYFFSYKRSFLIADQKQYLDTKFHIPFHFLNVFLGIGVLLTTQNYIIFLLIQIITPILENLYIVSKVNEMYPFLLVKPEASLPKEYLMSILKNVKALMFHKFGSVIVFSTDNLIISKFVGILEVGLYSNYLLIIDRIGALYSLVFQSLLASVGNLKVSEENSKSVFIFQCIDLVNFWMYTFAAIAFMILLNPFLSLWVGKEYLFNLHVVAIIVINFYITGRRKSVLLFKDAMGLYHPDRYKSFFESIINLVFSIVLAKYYGIFGVFAGTFISSVTTVLWIEPLVVYKHGFKTSVLDYFKKYSIFTSLSIILYFSTSFVTGFIGDGHIINFILKMFFVTLIPNLILFILFRNSNEFKYIFNSIKSLRKN